MPSPFQATNNFPKVGLKFTEKSSITVVWGHLQSNSLTGLRDDKAFVLLIETFLLIADNRTI
jgi:hypothetical protein